MSLLSLWLDFMDSCQHSGSWIISPDPDDHQIISQSYSCFLVCLFAGRKWPRHCWDLDFSGLSPRLCSFKSRTDCCPSSSNRHRLWRLALWWPFDQHSHGSVSLILKLDYFWSFPSLQYFFDWRTCAQSSVLLCLSYRFVVEARHSVRVYWLWGCL